MLLLRRHSTLEVWRKMANFDKIPVPYGFWVSCFPVKVERASAGWVRAVALVEKEAACA